METFDQRRIKTALAASWTFAPALRAGLATSAAVAAGVSDRAIMAQTGHTSVVLARRHIGEGSLFWENAALLSALEVEQANATTTRRA